MAPPARHSRRVLGATRITTVVAVTLLAVLSGVQPPVPARAQDATREAAITWFASLVPTGGDTNVRLDADGLRLGPGPTGPASLRASQPEGMLLTAAHPLAELSSQVTAELTAIRTAGSSVDLDVRGTRGDGSWTEWVPTSPKTPALLGAAVTSVQTRIVLRGGRNGTSPLVRSVRLSARPGVQLLAARPRTPPSYQVFATREGLVKHRTANGHVIHERDHFVALPSRRGLSPLGAGDYTVKICASNGRCEWAPVWDVGPWNTTDDYWNSSEVRQSWNDLPRGRPQAQAAYNDGYHDGLDQFRRDVLNPAGIDLADGTFWDGLKLRDNSWVTVTYLWTDGAPPAIVRIPTLPVRSGPGAQYPAVGLVAQGAEPLVECTVTGQLVPTDRGPTDRWLRIGPKQFISAAYVSLQAGLPAPGKRCVTP